MSPIVCRVLCLSVLVCITFCPFELVSLLLLSFECFVTVYVLCLLLTVLWVGLQCLSVVFSDHNPFLFTTNPVHKK